ncbi:hypothetical protein VA7868_03637 [Vibrio aerogenes CECT 7868]|uniref:Polysaccharide deacetylase n=1 Tax=Vibrio aerogenes CECT 7868 TaxID=1216006 RepID=A0A1M6AQM9_9VIBR|nr:polysaccharide deacetylase family protein [Vibrio aerogenes]SHI38628.1 hypothetical protein VA7868_03637 [Vibrio aerogenes CECT 7868]
MNGFRYLDEVATMAVPHIYFALNIEDSTPSGLGHGFTGVKFDPDYKNHSWRMYGLQEGMFNLLEMFRHHQVPLALLINSDFVEKYPALVVRLREYQNVEVIGHGQTNTDYFHQLDFAQQVEYSRHVKDVLESGLKLPVKGWLSPWINGNEQTIPALFEAGYTYTLDRSVSDFVGEFQQGGARLAAVPYNIEVNDTPSLCAKSLSNQDYFQSIIDYIDGLRFLARTDAAPVAAFPLHTPVAGRPHRLVYLDSVLSKLKQRESDGELVLSTPGAILSGFRQQ